MSTRARMSDSRRAEQGGGMSGWFGGMLFIAFLVLKLTHVIAWSWLWVTAPLWAPIALGLLILGAALVVGVFANRQLR